jgi:hypothetical protein
MCFSLLACFSLSLILWYLNFRADHNLQDVRAKVFPFKRKKVNAEQAEYPNTLPIKRKERSISSLVVNTPRITPAGSTGRRSRAVTRKTAALRGLGPIIVDPLKKDNDKLNKKIDNSSLLSSLSKVPQTRRQVNKYPGILKSHFFVNKSHPITCVSFVACCVMHLMNRWKDAHIDNTHLAFTFAGTVKWGHIKPSLW